MSYKFLPKRFYLIRVIRPNCFFLVFDRASLRKTLDSLSLSCRPGLRPIDQQAFRAWIDLES
jgi:hypothetical protein